MNRVLNLKNYGPFYGWSSLQLFTTKSLGVPGTQAALQINIIPLLVTMNRKIKKPLVKLDFQQSQ